MSCLHTQVEIQTPIEQWSEYPDRNNLWSDFTDQDELWSYGTQTMI